MLTKFITAINDYDRRGRNCPVISTFPLLYLNVIANCEGSVSCSLGRRVRTRNAPSFGIRHKISSALSRLSVSWNHLERKQMTKADTDQVINKKYGAKYVIFCNGDNMAQSNGQSTGLVTRGYVSLPAVPLMQ